MKPILAIFSTLLVSIALGIGAIALFWKPIDKELAEFYNPSDEEDYVVEDEEDEEPLTALEIEEENAQNFISLALAALHEDPVKCWQYLDKAVEKDPHNLEARIFRAQILESAGKPSLAREEYTLAKAQNPHDLKFVDNYAGFLIRTGRQDEAYVILANQLKPPNNPEIWLKALFVGKIYHPLSYDWTKYRIPGGPAKPLVHYLARLPKDKFWDSRFFDKVPYKNDYLSSRQATYWLQLLDALENGQENFAWNLMNNSPFKSESWNPALEINLLRILNFRKNRSLAIEEKSPLFLRRQKIAQKMTNLSSKLQDLADKEDMGLLDYEIPSDDRKLLLSGSIFAIALIDVHWDEASLKMPRDDLQPFPEWTTYSFARALRQNRGNLAALKFVSSQKETPELSLLTAKLLLDTGNQDKAIVKLYTLSQTEDETGREAAKLLVNVYIRNREFQKAREFIERTPNLSDHITGKELLARTFIEDSQPELAYRIYLTIEQHSAEAKSFLARRAYREKDWKKAKRLTEQLIAEFPDNEKFRQNLEKIKEKSVLH